MSPPRWSARNKNMTRRLHRAVAAFIALVFVSFAGIQATAAPDYRGMVDRIGAFLDEAVVLYRAGQVENAKSKVDQSYFEVFENLEGPIRVNISSKKNNELEAEFGAIRTMIKEGKPPEEVEVPDQAAYGGVARASSRPRSGISPEGGTKRRGAPQTSRAAQTGRGPLAGEREYDRQAVAAGFRGV